MDIQKELEKQGKQFEPKKTEKIVYIQPQKRNGRVEYVQPRKQN